MRSLIHDIITLYVQWQEEQAIKNHKRRLEFEGEILEQKMEFEKQAKASPQEQLQLSSAAKLPKLSIAKLNGKLEEWLRFLGKLICFSPIYMYLRELLETNVRTDVDGLPVTKEGFKIAKQF